jgi:hypothetical protein
MWAWWTSLSFYHSSLAPFPRTQWPPACLWSSLARSHPKAFVFVSLCPWTQTLWVFVESVPSAHSWLCSVSNLHRGASHCQSVAPSHLLFFSVSSPCLFFFIALSLLHFYWGHIYF